MAKKKATRKARNPRTTAGGGGAGKMNAAGPPPRVPYKGGTRAPARKWQQHEDDQLRYAMSLHEGKTWPFIAQFVPGRSPSRFCGTLFRIERRCIAQLRPGSLFLLSALRFLDRRRAVPAAVAQGARAGPEEGALDRGGGRAAARARVARLQELGRGGAGHPRAHVQAVPVNVFVSQSIFTHWS